MDCSLPGSSIHGIFQARVLEWVAIAFSIFNCIWTKIHKATKITGGLRPLVELCVVPAGFSAEKAMAPHSSTLAWKIPWIEEPGRLQSMGSLRVRHD